MFKAVLACPLRHAAAEINFAAADLPPFISELDNRAHRAGADDSPLAFGHIGNLHHFALNQSGDRADPDGIADPINIASQRRLPMVDILWRTKHLEIKTGPAFAEHIYRVALVKIDSPG